MLISWGDIFRDGDRHALRYGFNNDFLAYFPLRGSNEGLLFANHEYPDPFFLHGYKPDGGAKTPAQVQEEQDSVGNSILHVKRRQRRQLEGGLAVRVQPAHLRRPPAAGVHRSARRARPASAPA